MSHSCFWGTLPLSNTHFSKLKRFFFFSRNGHSHHIVSNVANVIVRSAKESGLWLGLVNPYHNIVKSSFLDHLQKDESNRSCDAAWKICGPKEVLNEALSSMEVET